MIYGSPYGSGYGDPQNAVAYFEAVPKRGGSAISCRLLPRAGWGNAFWQFYRNAKLFTTEYVTEGFLSPSIDIPNENGSTQTSILALRVGALADPLFDCSNVALTYETATAPRFTIRWQWTNEILGSPDGGNYTSNWTSAGVTFAACRRSLVHPTWTTLDYDLVYDGLGHVTVTVRNGNSGTLATGTGAVGGTITVATANGSGMSFTVTVSAGVNGSGTVNFRWPKNMAIKRGAADPPTVVVDTADFNFNDFKIWTEKADVAAGTYYYRIMPNTDTGEPGVDSATMTAVIPGAPLPPLNLARQSGNAAATVLQFNASLTPGATYNLYTQQPSAGFMNFSQTPVTVGPFTAGSLQTINAPAITGYAGTAYFILRAVNGGTEEQNCVMVPVEYDSGGVFVAPRPNTPNLVEMSAAITAGRTINIRGVYNNAGQKGVATQLKLYSRTPSGVAAAVFTASLATAVDGIQSALLTYTFPADGYYYISITALTAAGAESATASSEYLVYVSTELAFANAAPYQSQVARG